MSLPEAILPDSARWASRPGRARAQRPEKNTQTGYAIIGIGTIAYHFMAGIQNTTKLQLS